MVDFLMSPSGDLLFSERDKADERLKVHFYKSNVKSLKISFDMESHGMAQANSDSTLVVSFDLLNVEDNKSAKMVYDNAALMQQIYMRLKTSIGEVKKRPEIGTVLEAIMHENIMSKDVHKKIEKIVGEAIKDMLDNYKIKVVPKVSRENGYDQIINIYIYNNDSLILKHGMEW